VQEKMRIACKFLVVKPKEEDRCEDGRIILKCILRKSIGSMWVGFIWLRIGPVVGFCKLLDLLKGNLLTM
jgi:hypothetical protein